MFVCCCFFLFSFIVIIIIFFFEKSRNILKYGEQIVKNDEHIEKTNCLEQPNLKNIEENIGAPGPCPPKRALKRAISILFVFLFLFLFIILFPHDIVTASSMKRLPWHCGTCTARPRSHGHGTFRISLVRSHQTNGPHSVQRRR